MEERASPRRATELRRRMLVPLVLAAALLAAAGPVLSRAAFKPDDYRYLWQLREMDVEGAGALLRATVVENRWDHWWWIEDGTYVRFLRPFVIASFAVDRALFGEDPRAFLASNLLWHFLSSLALYACLVRLVSPGAALIGALVYTIGAARYEQVAYVAGRTDTLAALAFFGAYALFLARRERPARACVPWVAGAYAVALFAKEYAALLPVLLLATDRWVPAAPRPHGSGDDGPQPASLLQLVRQRASLYLSCGAVLLVYLAVRSAALGAGGAGARPFPYFHLPTRDGFLEHALAAWLQNGAYLVTGQGGPAFLRGVGELVDTVGLPGVLLAGAVVAALLVFGARRAGAGRLFAFQFVLTLVPLLPLYTTARYLALASLGWCGLVGLAAARLGERAAWLGGAWILAALLPQGLGLYRAATSLPVRPPGKSEGDALVELFRASELHLSDGRPIVLLDAPLHWLHLQFAPFVLAVEEELAPPVLWVLTKTPPDRPVAPTRVAVVGPNELELSRRGQPLVHAHPWGDFDAAPRAEGELVREAGYEVLVVESHEGQPTRVRVRFDRPLDELQVVALRTTPEGARWVSALP